MESKTDLQAQLSGGLGFGCSLQQGLLPQGHAPAAHASLCGFAALGAPTAMSGAAQPAGAPSGPGAASQQAVINALSHWADPCPGFGKAGQKLNKSQRSKAQKRAASGKRRRANTDAPPGQPAADGVSVALFNQFVIHKGKNGGDTEFMWRADDYATKYQAAGWRGSSLLWNTSTPFTSMGTLVGAIQSIHTALQQLASRRDGKAAADKPPASSDAGEPPEHPENTPEAEKPATSSAAPTEDAAHPAEPDRSTQIKNVAIFTHGLEYGLAVDAKGHTYHGNHGLHKEHGEDQSNIPQFVRSVSGALTSDVDVQLYACSTGRDAEHTKGWTKKSKKPDPDALMPEEGEQLGRNSFAAKLAVELQEQGHTDASVYGHTNAAHATENPNARVFGHAAGADQSKHMFEVLYPPEFIDAELTRLIPDLAERPSAVLQTLRTRLREQMFKHYKDCISGELERKNENKKTVFSGGTKGDRYLGMEAFARPAATAQTLQADFQTRWMTTARIKTMVGEKVPHVTGMKD